MSNISLVDSHAHLDMKDFDKDREQVINRAINAGVNKIITVGIGLESSKKAIALSEKYTQILAAVGIHPHDTSLIKIEDIKTLSKIARHPNVVAIGETGLDFFRNRAPREKQIEAFKWQLELATELTLPVIIHCRQAEKDMLTLLRDWTQNNKSQPEQSPGVIHCFNGDSSAARQYLDMGFYLSLGGYIGYPTSRNSHSLIKEIPGNRLLIETDCPFLPPQAYRGKRNEPAYVEITAEVLAKIREVPLETVARETTQNALRLFNRK